MQNSAMSEERSLAPQPYALKSGHEIKGLRYCEFLF
ncbi:hypothetical protein A311_00191 [Escherichia coli KTE146]|nr:hypothetical protein A311_00191 [Escherichia coli KTE146]